MKLGAFGERCLAVLLLILSVFMVGCGQLEIEDRAFPLALAVSPAEDGLYEFSFFFEDVDSSGEGLYHREDAVVTAAGYPQAFTIFGREQAAQLDDSHMKVVLLSEELLSDEAFLDSFYHYFIKEDHFSWNTMVYLIDENSEKPQKLKERTGGRIGTYLRDMAESDEQEKTASVPTLGDLYKEWNNHAKVLLLPVLGKSELPVVSHYRLLVQGEAGDAITVDAARLLQLLNGDLKKFQMQLSDGTVVGMEGIRLKRELLSGQGEKEHWRVTLCMECETQNRVDLSDSKRRKLLLESESLLRERIDQVEAWAPVTGSDGSLLLPDYEIKLSWVE